MKRIDVLMPSSSQYRVLHHFTKKLYEAFIRQGHSCRLLEGDDRILLPLKTPPDFSVGFNGALKMEDGSLFCDYIKVPHIACLVDPPYRFPYLTNSPYVYITCDDQLGCQLLRNLPFKRTLYLPHAIEADLCPENDKRIYDIVFLGTFIDAEKRRKQWRRQFPAKIWRLMDKAAEAALADDSTSFITVLNRSLSPWECQSIYEEVEIYIKGRDRLDLIRALNGLPVHIFGGTIEKMSWKKALESTKSLTVHPPVSYEEAITIMKQSKIVLNSSIKNKLGAHERLFTAAACGAAVVTNNNPYVASCFTHERDIFLYQRSHFDTLGDAVGNLLADDNKRSKLAARGRQIVMKHHTWDHRVMALQKWMGKQLTN